MVDRKKLKEMGLILNLQEEETIAQKATEAMCKTWEGLGYDSFNLSDIKPIMVRFVLAAITEHIGEIEIHERTAD